MEQQEAGENLILMMYHIFQLLFFPLAATPLPQWLNLGFRDSQV